MNVSIICACLPVLSGVFNLVKQKLRSISIGSKQPNDQETEDSYYLPLTSLEKRTGQSTTVGHVHEITICTTFKTDGTHFNVSGQIPTVHVRRDITVS